MPKVFGFPPPASGLNFRGRLHCRKSSEENRGCCSGHRLLLPSNILPSRYMAGQLHLRA